MANAHHSKEKYEQIANKIRGQKRTEETRKRISEALKGYKHSAETLKKLRGRKRSPEARKRISEAMKGKKVWNKGKTGIYSPEQIENLRRKNVGKKHSEESRLKMRDATIAYLKSKDPNYVPPPYEDGISRRTHQEMRRRRTMENGGSHTKAQWEGLKAAYNYQCLLCQKSEPEITLTKDHIIPLRSGGSNDIANIQPLCGLCNSKKG